MENMWKNGQPIITVIAKEKSRGSRISTYTHFTRLKQKQTKNCSAFCTANQSTKTNLRKYFNYTVKELF